MENATYIVVSESYQTSGNQNSVMLNDDALGILHNRIQSRLHHQSECVRLARMPRQIGLTGVTEDRADHEVLITLSLSDEHLTLMSI